MPDASAAVTDTLTRKRVNADAVLDHIHPGADLIVGVANGEPKTVIDAIEAGAAALSDVRIHQMLPVRDRPYFHGKVPGLRHVSWFLSPYLRESFRDGQCDLVPNSFSEVPHLMRTSTKCSLLLAAASPPDENGFFSLGPHAEYIAALAGRCSWRPTRRCRARAARTTSTSATSSAGVRRTIRWSSSLAPHPAMPTSR
jgi:acyl-CoA hydrolase